MYEYALIIVDMQPCFPAAKKRKTLKAVEREILKAIKLKMPIVALEVEYVSPRDDRFPRTHKRLLKHLNGYFRYRMQEKRFDDGSPAALWGLSQLGFEGNCFRVCGVNTDACVLDTVKGLSKMLPDSRIYVLKEACNTLTKTNCWPEFSQPNVLVVSRKRKALRDHRIIV